MNLRRAPLGWLFGRGSPDDEPEPVQSRVYFPSERTCPEHVLRGLRAIDPAAELVYTGRSRWLLGVVNWNWERVKSAGMTLNLLRKNVTRMEYGITRAEQVERARANAERSALRLLAIQGFRPIATYTLRDPDGRIVEDFRVRDWLYRYYPELTVNEGIDHAAGVPQQQARIARLRDASQTRGVDALRHVRRGPGATVTNLGLIGAA